MRTYFTLSVMLIFPALLFAQSFPTDRFKTENVTWFGIDYSKVQMFGEEGFIEPQKIVDVYFGAWNRFVFTESSKYDVRGSLGKRDVKIDLSYVKEKNSTVNPDDLVVDKLKQISQTEVDSILASYQFNGLDGIGTMLIAEFYNKRNLSASYLFIVFDVQSKSILFSRKYSSVPRGFGFKNYWARTFYTTLNLIGNDVRRWVR